MKRILTIHFILRLAPVLLFCLLMLMDLASECPDGRVLRICCYLLAASAQYLAYPLTREEVGNSVRFCVVSSIYFICACCVQGGRDMADFLFLLPGAGFVILYMLGGLFYKYREPKAIFRKDAAWCCAEEDSRTFYSILVLVLSVALVVLRYEGAPPALYYVFSVVILALNVLLHIRAYSGRTILLGRKKEKRIQAVMLSSGHLTDVVPEVENTILERAYKRIEQCMREDKPYLDDRFSLERMAEILKTNKVYISRAVNKFTNKNFRQYVNWHRVMYSVELMRADPWLKVIELAFMSGFHSQVTYNMCFKLFLDETPSDMVARLRLTKPRPEVSKIEVRLPQNGVLPYGPDAKV